MEAFAYTDDISLGFMGVTANTIRAVSFVRSGRDDIGIVVNRAKTVALPRSRNAPMAEEVSLVESIDICMLPKRG